jgi:hypothetical protein
LLTLPMADQGHSLGGTGNRLLGVTSALGSLGRGLGVGMLGVHQRGGLPSLNEGCASAVAICKKLNEPNATRRKMRFSFIILLPEALAIDRAMRSEFNTSLNCNIA